VEDKELRCNMGKEARNRVLCKFNWELAAKQILKVYQEVL
jgi:glycosyltransferase involved in cell wall biosynthesis